jgi:hypothetical protein
MRVLWARKLERYQDLMSFHRRRFLSSYFFSAANVDLVLQVFGRFEYGVFFKEIMTTYSSNLLPIGLWRA